MARKTPSRSCAPKQCEMTTPAPSAVPLKKLTKRKMSEPEELTAASESVPRNCPTMTESAALYSCWNTWLRKTGMANWMMSR